MRTLLVFIAVVAGNVAAAGEVAQTFTLYRSSPADPLMRVHMATFDAKEPLASYNRDNCWLAADLFMAQVGVSVRYWCEPGEYAESR